jgi:rod shape determining protein RodA
VEVLQDYQVERLTAFIGAERDTSDAGYQLDQSKTAIGSGGALGKGPDGATQANNDFLPEHHTDFIFAVTSEMFGFVGGGLLILLFALILWRGLRTMARASSQVDMLVAGAILAMFGFQVFVNIGMTVGIMPITGIPLPLMSYGGSHTLTTFVAVGLLLGIHRRRSAVPG